MTYVIDSGTSRERMFRYSIEDIVKVHNVREFFPSLFSEDWQIEVFLAKLPPLPPGDHTYDSIFTLSTRVCDGLGNRQGL